jgi:hypothetical protein
MSAARHTPGPWFVDPECNGNISAEHNHQLAIVTARYVGERPDYAEAKANARLIAAAPELLDALRDAVKQCDCGINHVRGCWTEHAREVIAKAEGR